MNPGVSPVTGVAPVAGLNRAAAAAPISGTGADFGVNLADAVDQLQGLQANSQNLAVQAVTGQLDDIHDYTIAAAEASTSLQLAAALRDRAVGAFQEIMRMQA
jgi:flagellar hook-basal body complex protein FliE